MKSTRPPIAPSRQYERGRQRQSTVDLDVGKYRGERERREKHHSVQSESHYPTEWVTDSCSLSDAPKMLDQNLQYTTVKTV